MAVIESRRIQSGTGLNVEDEVSQALDDDDPDDEDDDELHDDPDESDQDADEGDEVAETVPCPFCRKRIFEQAELCPHCGNYISHEDAPRRVPLFIWVGAILAILCVLTWILM